jgi:purine/pyrimidine-nucleoside phosphorylase
MIELNEYFGGQVKSLAAHNSYGKATLGVIAPGEYEFGTGTIEIMNIVWGKIQVLLPGENEWKSYQAGTMFRVEKGLKFKVKADENVGYLCQYLP